ncbi:high-affinity Zn(2+) transporter zrt1, partial [Cladochytrium tenue]
LVKLFGIGVIAGTAWIHLLPDAFSQFSSSCLDAGWQDYGPAYVGLFGLIAAFVVQLLETTAAQHVAGRELRAKTAAAAKAAEAAAEKPSGAARLMVAGATREAAEPGSCEAVHPRTASSDEALTVEAVVASSVAAASGRTLEAGDEIAVAGSGQHVHVHGGGATTASGLATGMLEAGILFHSVVIGLALGVTPDGEFSTLLAAVCFHQLFEGMALGSLLGEVAAASSGDDGRQRRSSLVRHALQALLYPLSTPLGTVIGIAVRGQFNSNSSGLILLQGILDSLSAGILFYNTYAELMSVEVAHSAVFRHFSPAFKAACYLAMYCGAGAMAVVGIWA